jgi:hypothetical protein
MEFVARATYYEDGGGGWWQNGGPQRQTQVGKLNTVCTLDFLRVFISIKSCSISLIYFTLIWTSMTKRGSSRMGSRIFLLCLLPLTSLLSPYLPSSFLQVPPPIICTSNAKNVFLSSQKF